MTDELASFGPGSYITEFVSAGPKNCAFKCFCPETGKEEFVVKIRGFSLTYKASEKLNFNTLKETVHAFIKHGYKDHVDVTFPRIERKENRNVVTKNVSKRYTLVYDKRVPQFDFSSLPFGYV